MDKIDTLLIISAVVLIASWIMVKIVRPSRSDMTYKKRKIQ